MWIIKFLSGPNAGKEIFFQNGLYVLGRDESCKVKLTSKGVSKRHAQIIVDASKIRIEDLSSSNGTFLNGKQIQKSTLKEGDHIALGKVIFEIRKKELVKTHPYLSPYPQHMQNHTAQDNPVPSAPTTKQVFREFKLGIGNYVHKVILPGVYKCAEVMEFRWLIGLFVVGFIFLVVSFSSIPLIQILKSSVEQESRNHAESIATTVAKSSRKHLSQGLHSAISMDYALRRPGVKEAYIINTLNGQILAPSDRAHTYPKLPFVHKARKLDQVSVEKIGTSTIVALVPIRFFNKSSGDQSATAYSVVIYDMGTLAVSNSKVASLLIQNLFIASILGILLFFFLINLIEFPVRSINSQFSNALKDDEAPQVSVDYESKLLKDLCSNVNSALNQLALTRTSHNEKNLGSMQMSRQSEMDNLVEIIGFPSMTIQLEDNVITALNSNFKEQIDLDNLLHQSLESVSDTNFKNHLTQLLNQGNNQPEEISFGELEIQGVQFQTTCQLIMGNEKPAYAIITFVPNQEEGVA